MADIKIELNEEAVGALLKSTEMQSLLNEHAKRIAGQEYETELYVAGTRAVAEVKSRKRNNDLLRALKK